jgi:dTDP-4-amino-4,6-dideoxygalactose transaminase
LTNKVVIPLILPEAPDSDHFLKLVNEAVGQNTYSNRGPLVRQLEQQIGEIHDIPYVTLACNATVGLAASLYATLIESYGEVPQNHQVLASAFGFKATINAIRILGLDVKLLDIADGGPNMSIASVCNEIDRSKNIAAIIPTHCYGVSCAPNDYEELSARTGIPCVFDAAHCFLSMDDNGKAVAQRGNSSVVSLHATKIFHTCEGGFVVSPNAKHQKIVEDFLNFNLGNRNEYLGINGKMSEINAAFGLSYFSRVEEIVEHRRYCGLAYTRFFTNYSFLTKFCYPLFNEFPSGWNGAYFPIVFQTEDLRDNIYAHLLSEHGIQTRAYFSCLSNDSVVEHPNSLFLSRRVLCLPLHKGINITIIKVILESIDQLLSKLEC